MYCTYAEAITRQIKLGLLRVGYGHEYTAQSLHVFWNTPLLSRSRHLRPPRNSPPFSAGVIDNPGTLAYSVLHSRRSHPTGIRFWPELHLVPLWLLMHVGVLVPPCLSRASRTACTWRSLRTLSDQSHPEEGGGGVRGDIRCGFSHASEKTTSGIRQQRQLAGSTKLRKTS